MDGGFRRLWSRNRNKSNTSAQRSTPVNDNATYRSRRSMSTTDGRPSTTRSSNTADRPPSQDRLGSSRDHGSITSDEYSHSKSGHRIQPILVGISRPLHYSDRPATAGSVQNTFQHTANATSHKSSELLSTQAAPTNYHKNIHTPRYVDIFAVASSVPAHKSRFNEEIAERNLDVLRVAMEEEQSGYVPSSKYQEEVANRNASLSLGARASEDHGRSSMDMNGYISSPGRVGPGSNTFQPNGHHIRRFSGERDLPNGIPQEGITGHMQSHGSHGNNTSINTPAALYESNFRTDQHPVELSKDLVASSSKSYGKPASRGQIQAQPVMHTISEQSGLDQRFTSNERPKNLRRTGTGGSSSRDGYIDYALSPSELGGRAQSRQPPLRSIDTGYSSERRYMEPQLRAPSATSSRSHKRTINLQNRTIMDLTGEDDEISETSSWYGSENTPVIEQAKWDSIKRIVPNQPNTYSRVISDETTPTPGESDKQISAQYSEHMQSPSSSEDKPIPKSSKIAFSPISTLASVTPRASMIVQKEQPMTMVQRVTAALEARNASSSLQVPQTSTPLVKQSVLNNDAQSDGSQSGQLTPKAEALNSSRDVSHVPKIEPLEQPPSITKTVTTSDIGPAAQGHTGSRTPVQQTIPSIYESPQSLNSADYKNPAESFGVRTRDFALTPKKSASSLKKVESRSLQKSAAENAAKVAGQSQKKASDMKSTSRLKQRTASSQKVSSGGFDEEAFARKQANARAALERLQLSLKEDFMTMPLPEPPRSRVSYGSDSDGRPAAPVSTTSTSRSVARSSSSSQRADQEGPPSSYRGPSYEPTRVSSMSSTRSRSEGRTPRKSAPPSLKNIDAASAPINMANLPPSLLHVLETTSKPPRSPGEISLSSFPLPTSRPTSEHEPGNGLPMSPSVLSHSRRNSAKSQTSIASQFSIPFHMIPDRSSSVRETVAEEDEEESFTI